MADQKISQLTAVTTLNDTDEFVLARSGGLTRKITKANLATALGSEDPVASVLGSPDTAHEFTTSSFTGLTAMGTPDAEDAHTTIPSHYYLRDDGGSWVGRYVSPPSTPYTAVAKLSDHSLDADFGITGMFIGESTPGVMDFVYIVAANRQIKTARWTNPSTYSADINAGAQLYEGVPLYFAIIVNSSSDVDFLASFGGRIWFKLTDARNPSITIGSVGVAMNANSAGVMGTAFDYLRIFNSAKSFPGVP